MRCYVTMYYVSPSIYMKHVQVERHRKRQRTEVKMNVTSWSKLYICSFEVSAFCVCSTYARASAYNDL
jgi:hypothetical protein